MYLLMLMKKKQEVLISPMVMLAHDKCLCSVDYALW